jgi:hypothetical protein
MQQNNETRKDRIMATVRSLDGALDFEHRSLRGGFPGRSLLAGLATYWSAIREASAAAGEYERLVRRGMPHDEAVARVFEDHFKGR